MPITLRNYGNGQANSMAVDLDYGTSLYFSYATIVAFASPDTGLVVSENVWGSTTGKHLALIDGGSKEAKAARLPEDTFKRALSAFLVAHNLDGNP